MCRSYSKDNSDSRDRKHIAKKLSSTKNLRHDEKKQMRQYAADHMTPDEIFDLEDDVDDRKS